jgi:hypothetical protein
LLKICFKFPFEIENTNTCPLFFFFYCTLYLETIWQILALVLCKSGNVYSHEENPAERLRPSFLCVYASIPLHRSKHLYHYVLI